MGCDGITSGITRPITGHGGGGSSATQAPLITDAYDSDAVSTWQYGAGVVGDNQYGGMAGSANIMWGVRTSKLNLAPGVYTLTELQARIAFQDNADCDQVAFVLFEVSGSDLVQVAYLDLTSQKTTTPGTHTATFDLGGLQVTIESGKEYHFTLALRGAVTRTASRPGWRTRITDWALEDRFAYWTGTAGVTTIPTTITPTFFDGVGQGGYRLTFTTKNRIVFDGNVVDSMIPRRTDGYTSIKINTFVGDATPAVITLVDSDVSTGVVDRLILDIDHTSEEITFGGDSHGLVGQTGDTFDFLIQTNSTASGLLYLNRTDGATAGGEAAADIVTISHHAKEHDERGGTYTMGAATYRFMTVEGGGTIGSVQIGCEPLVVFGDSMATFSGRIGQYLPSAFTQPRISWRAAISGNRLTVDSAGLHTAGYLRYQHTTIGLGDLCEIRDAIFCVAMFGLNDISRIGTGDDAAITADYFDKLQTIIEDLQTNGNQPLVIGLAPYHHVSNASSQEAQAIIDWIDRYAYLCAFKRCAWMTPWWDLVDKTTKDDDIPEILAAYTDDSGTHINAAASQVVVALVAQAYESGKVGGPWGKASKRFRNG